MHHLQTEVFALDLPYHLPPLLAVHLLPTGLRWETGCFFALLLLLGFHADLPHVEFNSAQPGRRNLLNLSSGVGLSPFQDKAATIFTIAKTEAML
jgi:hypothetical protein